MKKNYDFDVIEKKVQKYCNDNNFFFHKNYYFKGKSFCIMVPPPNITGSLHMGHAFQQTIMDVLIRYKHMCKRNTLLQMGTDHAGIATQMVVERYLLHKEGKNKNLYTRKEFVKKILDWKKKSELIMFNQIKRLGLLIDWKKTRFTLDSNFSIAVNKVFIKLYEDGLIYRSKKLVYWDTQLKTVISDLEVENKISNNTMWYIKYFFVKKKNKKNLYEKYIVIATTRPETLLGDTALAVNPNDIRYKKYIGSLVYVPIINRIIPIISDINIDIKKGTGCMKITPAHDFNDYSIGVRNKLPMINIFKKNGKILKKLNIFDYTGKKTNIFDSDIPKDLQNKDRFIARKIILSKLKKTNFLKKSVSYKIGIPYGDRSKTILEPMLTNQWYLSTKSLAKIAITAIEEKKIKFIPKQYKNMYLSWMYNIQDWCISRQLWWGHQIPVWYDKKNNIYVGKNESSVRKKYFLKNDVFLYQDPDVLDTWFSSSLWTFAGLGWPIDIKKFNDFHPTNILVCGFDIIFFWISRMIMITMHIIKDKNGNPQIPFKKIYITGLIRDELGKKMSKSFGNTLDPIDMVNGIHLSDLIHKRINNSFNEKKIKQIKLSTKKNFPDGISKHSVDALRYTFLSLASTSRNISWDMNRLKGFQNFCNKIWNASRFVIKNISKHVFKKNFSFTLIDKWILIELNDVIKKYHFFFKKFRFDNISVVLYKFIWNKFCDQYLEMIKPIFKNGFNCEINSIKNTLCILLRKIILLIHPIMPYISIYIWKMLQKLNKKFNSKIIMNSFPIYNIGLNNIYIKKFMNWFQKIISILRCVRLDTRVSRTTLLIIYLKNIPFNKKIFLQENNIFLKKIAYLKLIIEINKISNLPSSIVRFIDNMEIFIPINSFLNVDLELKRLNKKIIFLEKQIKILKTQFLNTNFLIHAPSNLIKEKRSLLKRNYSILKKINYQKKILLKKI
ncbi:valine--tRNA ligase [Buchnera aphidicola]|uniref:Valine--tRNA ligase n=1 Tax=Buchnera aphidicola subsp. Cinara cedri (strain Cc) TaxID=372461 RepID=Q057K7_BUCCC|nr:valine--tRNA ligase [Buchnera aphidicola]ABJ90692.1 valyl-tRNA synthetase [Buchnera aphidicola BCc]